MKFVIVSGGVLSGLGKGVTSASIALLLKSHGIKVTVMKCDMYLNIDAGTMNPIEHGEVFVTDDGLETDQDLGHYERFLDQTLNRANYLTNGQIYKEVLDKERSLEYGGACVEPYHHIPPEIIKRWYAAGSAHKADVAIIELGGTVGEYEGLLFYESVRRLKLEHPKDIILIHVGYLPILKSIGELKSKPLQQSVQALNSLGLQPDFIVCRSEKAVDTKRKEKISLASGVSIDNIFSNPDVKTIYEIPIILNNQALARKVIKKLKLKAKKQDLKEWKAFLDKVKKVRKEINIGIVGKYQKTGDYTLEDSYVCVVESLKHASWSLGVSPKLTWISSEDFEAKSQIEINNELSKFDCIIVPQGWGKRGVEGKIKAITYARENNIPYLGLCYGMQMAAIEFARNVLKIKNANSEEVNPKTPNKIIHIMDNQKELVSKGNFGGTIRLGAWPCKIKKGTLLSELYGKNNISERHRHRYEFNNIFKNKFEKAGMAISGTSPDGILVEAIELTNHPFFIGTQFHPEYTSRPLSPHPIFVGLIKACLKK